MSCGWCGHGFDVHDHKVTGPHDPVTGGLTIEIGSCRALGCECRVYAFANTQNEAEELTLP